ncbi:MAG: hypothetical protein ACRD0H_21880, partial [Actinomycetes bacterium]
GYVGDFVTGRSRVVAAPPVAVDRFVGSVTAVARPGRPGPATDSEARSGVVGRSGEKVRSARSCRIAAAATAAAGRDREKTAAIDTVGVRVPGVFAGQPLYRKMLHSIRLPAADQPSAAVISPGLRRRTHPARWPITV